MNKRLVLLALLSGTTIGACRHKESKPAMIYVDSGTRQHFAFKPGSYWIYRDSVSGRVDSCYVTKLDSSMRRNDEYTKIYQTIYSEMIQRPILDPMSDSTIIWMGLGQNQLDIGYNTRQPPEKTLGIVLQYPFREGPIDSGSDSSLITHIFPEGMLAGLHYKNLVECFYSRYEHPENYTWLYINDSFGIIQVSIYSDDVIARKWELQRFHILK